MRDAGAGHEPVVLSTDQLPEWLRRHLPETGNLTADSRIVRSGDAFFALRGARHDGAAFIRQAVDAGAAAIVIEAARVIQSDLQMLPVPVCRVPDLKLSLGPVAADWYGQPSAELDLVAVTGTNGKTSVSHWIADGCNRLMAGERAVVVGTNGEGVPGTLRPLGMTTPDPLTVQRLFRRYLDEGIEVVALEASSIGLEQGRLNGSVIRTAVYTNLSRDHLDYHGSMDVYGEAKRVLFAWPGLKNAVVNLDDVLAPALLTVLQDHPAVPHRIGYLIYDALDNGDGQYPGKGTGADMPPALLRALSLADVCDEVLMAVAIEPGRWVLNLLQAPGVPLAGGEDTSADDEIDLSGVSDGDIEDFEQMQQLPTDELQQTSVDLDLQLIGRFNLSNALAVAGVWRAMGWSLDEIANQLAALKPVPGRMENILPPGASEAERAAVPLVVVDYAHTPDALENTLTALREVAQQRGGRLWCIFGAGGNRDAGKRPQMAAVAERLADRVVPTSDNPRDEDPKAILEDVVAGLRGEAWLVEADRKKAIDAVVAAASPQDVVLVAGKGREATQEIAGVFHPFSDPDTVAQALMARLDRDASAGRSG
ncbi:MAG: UDP-N-acetylmuramoyl-L-alanyl-D-glutamate--2,6-diaminopimelate ligase [Lautropia sp.]|nr:UDP-N-acetylmuramoyl-L-alanyl-D-glutamate--2,6-diaminopimelate ligase [Lautropia sp.]